MRILIADEDTSFASALAQTLSPHDEFEVVGFARDPGEAELLIEQLKPGLVVADAGLCPVNGKRRQEPAFVVLTGENGQPGPGLDAAGVVACARKADAVMMIDLIVGFARFGLS